jgi:hypothetical protein
MEAVRGWWTHDAAWYQGVLSRFGQDVANEINAEAISRAAAFVGRRVAQTLEKPVAEMDIEQVRAAVLRCRARMLPQPLSDSVYTTVGDDGYEIVTSRVFALNMLRLAGTLEGYACPCENIFRGWSEGLGLTVTECGTTSCVRDGSPTCRTRVRVSGHDVEAEPGPGSGDLGGI